MRRHFKAIDLYFVAIVLAACSILYELILANALSMISNKHIVWYSLTIGCFIAGLGMGATRVKDESSPLSKLIRIELTLALVGALSVGFIYFLRASYDILEFFIHLKENFAWAASYQVGNRLTLNIVYYGFSLFLALLIGFLSGYEVPLLLKCVEERFRTKEGIKEQTYEHVVLGFNYFGTLLGTLIYSYLLFPYIGFVKSAAIVALANTAVCLYLLARRFAFVHWASLPALALTILITFIFVKAERIEQTYTKINYFYDRMAMQERKTLKEVVGSLDEMPDIERYRTLYQLIDINHFHSDKFGKIGFLSLNTNFQFSTRGEEMYHEAFAHLPFQWLDKVPRKVLLLGGGDGLLIRELIKYEEIEEIQQIELDAKMIDLAKNHPFLTGLNRGAYKDPRVDVRIGDAFQLSRQLKEKYDAILIDFPFPRNMDLMRLYSLEFYKALRDNLSSGGFIVLDGPVYGDVRSEENMVVVGNRGSEYRKRSTSVLLSTAYHAGYRGLRPYTIDVHSFLIMAPEKLPTIEPAPPGSYVDSFDFSSVRKSLEQEFDYSIERDLVNSIFAPRF